VPRPAQAFTVLAVGLVLVATLTPGGWSVPPSLCVLCGSQSVADAVANMVLFLPLGAALVASGVSLPRALLLGALLSASVEVAQATIVSGRDASLGDLVFDAAGTLLGGGLAVTAPRWLVPTRRAAHAFAAGASAAVLGVIALTGVFTRLALPETTWYGQWTPQFSDQEPYRGHVLGARIGRDTLPSHRLRNGSAVRRDVLDGQRLVVKAVSSPPTHDLSTLFSIYDIGPHRMLLLGVRGADIELFVRRRATPLWLVDPPLRVASALSGVTGGDTIVVTVRRTGATWCVGVEPRVHCGLGYTAGDGWRMLVDSMAMSHWLPWLDAVWLAGLMAVPCFWYTGKSALWMGPALLAAGCAAVPALCGLSATPPLQWLGAALGAAAGWAAGAVLRARHAA